MQKCSTRRRGFIMKIEHLKYFLEVARTGSTHKAAEELFLTPQNLGLIIKSLEKEIGEDLFIRTSKGMRLTAEGEKFVPYAREMVEPYDRYFSSKKKSSNIIKLYTTPALAKEIRELQEILWDGQYYLSVQKKSPDDLIEMLHKGVEGIYFLAVLQKNIERLQDLKHFVSLFVENKSFVVCHQNNPILQHVVTPEVLQNCLMIYGESYDEGQNSVENSLHIDDIVLCKKLLEEKNAVYSVLSHLYYKYFREQGKWVVAGQLSIPTYEFIIMYNMTLPKTLETEIAEYMKKLFVVG